MSDDRAASPPIVVGASPVVEPGDATAPPLECDTTPPTPEFDATPRVKPETSPPAQLGNTTAPPLEPVGASGRPAWSAAPRLVLVAGASGSGKSRLARHSACLQFRLDDFYYDADYPGHVMTAYGIIDWDDPAAWNAAAAVEALRTLIDRGEVEVPVYSISESRATGRHTVRLDGRGCIVAEGIFAIELRAHLERAGMAAEAIYLDRPGWLVFWLRLRRDLALKRKPPLVLLRRGWALWRAQPGLKRKAVAAGFRPLSMRRALAVIAAA
ncbi:MAG: uridine kinase [Propionicimonas sp.]|nr:uridine kinase [Propionicimonas sp.]